LIVEDVEVESSAFGGDLVELLLKILSDFIIILARLMKKVPTAPSGDI